MFRTGFTNTRPPSTRTFVRTCPTPCRASGTASSKSPARRTRCGHSGSFTTCTSSRSTPSTVTSTSTRAARRTVCVSIDENRVCTTAGKATRTCVGWWQSGRTSTSDFPRILSDYTGTDHRWARSSSRTSRIWAIGPIVIPSFLINVYWCYELTSVFSVNLYWQRKKVIQKIMPKKTVMWLITASRYNECHVTLSP